MNNFTFLAEDQIFGQNQLEIFKKIGTRAALTDFAIVLGAYVSDCYLEDSNDLKDRTGYWWTKTDDGDNDARVVHLYGTSTYSPVLYRSGGARPALTFSSISSFSSNGVRGKKRELEIEYGEYPQTVEHDVIAEQLERKYRENSLELTGKSYTTDSREIDAYDKTFQKREHLEYQYNGKKYIRIIADKNCVSKKLSNNKIIKENDVIWIKVEPIKWIIDEKKDIAISKKLLFSGVQFKNKRDYKGDFSKTDMHQFMNGPFAKEIEEGLTYSQTKEEITLEEQRLIKRKQNPYQFNFNFVSEEEIIRGALVSDIPVLLHGRSSEGKSARVKQYDPDCEIIYLRNATPDSLNGKSVYVQPIYEQRKVPHIKLEIDQETQTKKEVMEYTYESVEVKPGHMLDIPPTWLQKVQKKCEEEPDKIHIVFFDEITNALPSIQGMAFNIVLDKEVNGIWKLPENARIVAAGNDLNDSLAANTMAEPLFNRFAHVYINTTVDNWLKWATTPKGQYERLKYTTPEVMLTIHPSIYAYIAYRSYTGEDVLRTPFNGEKPNADPRKWEMASKVLYQTKKPEMLRALIGEELTRDFVAFVKQKVITIEDVLNGEYSEEEIRRMNIAEKFATAVGLSSVDDQNLIVVRSFVKKLGAEPCATFESIWAHQDEERLEKLAELIMEEKQQGGMRV